MVVARSTLPLRKICLHGEGAGDILCGKKLAWERDGPSPDSLLPDLGSPSFWKANPRTGLSEREEII